MLLVTRAHLSCLLAMPRGRGERPSTSASPLSAPSPPPTSEVSKPKKKTVGSALVLREKFNTEMQPQLFVQPPPTLSFDTLATMVKPKHTQKKPQIPTAKRPKITTSLLPRRTPSSTPPSSHGPPSTSPPKRSPAAQVRPSPTSSARSTGTTMTSWASRDRRR